MVPQDALISRQGFIPSTTLTPHYRTNDMVGTILEGVECRTVAGIGGVLNNVACDICDIETFVFLVAIRISAKVG
jgi:hypothetical protein